MGDVLFFCKVKLFIRPKSSCNGILAQNIFWTEKKTPLSQLPLKQAAVDSSV